MQLFQLPAHELAKLLAGGKTSSEEIVRSLLSRNETVDKSINAMVEIHREEVLAESRVCDQKRRDGQAKGALFGLPFTVKENIEVKGYRTTIGLRARQDIRANVNAVSVQLLQEQGAFVLGTTNVAQTLLAMESTNNLYGTTNNPWDTSRTCGGSSGGEAAAIASGQSLFGIGGDVGGSIRTPAAYCGIVGIKPTLHRWSNRGMVGALPGQEFVRAQLGPLARNTRDLTMFFYACSSKRHAQLDPEVPPLGLDEPSSVNIQNLRIGYYEDDGYLTPSTAVRRGVREAVEYLRARGATMVPFVPPNATSQYPLVVAGLTSDGMETLAKFIGNEPLIAQVAQNAKLARTSPFLLEQLSRALKLLGESRLSAIVARAGKKTVSQLWAITKERLDAYRAEFDAWNAQNLDAVICPGTASPAPRHGDTSDFTAATIYTMRYNLINLPAGSVPVTRVAPSETVRVAAGKADRIEKRHIQIDSGSAGLPISVQVIARPYREDVVFALMQAIEDDAQTAGSSADLRKLWG